MSRYNARQRDSVEVRLDLHGNTFQIFSFPNLGFDPLSVGSGDGNVLNLAGMTLDNIRTCRNPLQDSSL